MSFLESVVPDITETIPTSISARVNAPVFVNSKTKADVSINDLAFRFAISDQNPYQRETAEYKRQQIDTSREAGENTLSQWWVRDQNSWHRGAGINFYEPGVNPTNTSQYSNNITEFRYTRSVGVNPWIEGSVTLQHSCSVVVSATGSQQCYATGAIINGVNSFVGIVNESAFRHDGTTRTDYTGATGLIFDPVVTGHILLIGSNLGIYSGDVAGTSLSLLWTSSTGVPVRVWWSKSRIIAARGNALYDLTLAGGSIDSATPLYTHPSATWTWTGVADAPSAILASGYDNGYGFIFKFALNDLGSSLSPTLGSAIQIAEFPPGEEVHSIRSYLAQYIGIGTSRGVRIGTIDSGSSNITYGPLTVECSQPVLALSARDRFVYAAIQDDIDGHSGLARIDLSQGIVDLRFAWAYDAQAQAGGRVLSATFLGTTDQSIFGLVGQGVYVQSATAYEAEGYVTSGRIRFDTTEPKAFNLLKVRARLANGTTIRVSTIDQFDNEVFLVALGGSWNTDDDLTLRSLADSGQAHASIKLTLTSDQVNNISPELQSLQVKATPLPRKQRNIKFPLRLEDVEVDANGVKTGKKGLAITRLMMLEDLEQSRSTVLVRDFTSGESFSAQILQVQFIRDTPPSRNRTNFGGIVNVTVLKL